MTRPDVIRAQTGRMDGPEIHAFLDGYPDRMIAIAERLRSLVRETLPDSTERVRAGWRIIGYDVPVGCGRP